MIDRRVPQDFGVCFPHVLRMLIIVGAGIKDAPVGGRSVEQFTHDSKLSGNALRTLCSSKSNPRSDNFETLKRVLAKGEEEAQSIKESLDAALNQWRNWSVEERELSFENDMGRIGCTEKFEANRYIDYFAKEVLEKIEWDDFLERALSQGYPNSLRDYSSEVTLPRVHEVSRLSRSC